MGDFFDNIFAGQWKEPLFGCLTNPGVCIITYFLPCIYAGMNAEESGCLPSWILGSLCFLIPIAGNVMLSKTRAATRERYRIPGNLLEDFCVTCFCPCCQIIQVNTQLQEPVRAPREQVMDRVGGDIYDQAN